MSNLANALKAFTEPAQTTTPAVGTSQTKYPSPWVVLKVIGDDIKNQRRSQGMTQRELAQKSGMSQGTITRIERHGSSSAAALVRVAQGLGKVLTIQ